MSGGGRGRLLTITKPNHFFLPSFLPFPPIFIVFLTFHRHTQIASFSTRWLLVVAGVLTKPLGYVKDGKAMIEEKLDLIKGKEYEKGSEEGRG